MTFLGFAVHDGVMKVAMDTMATIEGNKTMYLEKSFYIQGAKSVISMKGSVNILGPFMLELFKRDRIFPFVSPQEIEKYVKTQINQHLMDRLRTQPRLEGQKIDLWIFSWKNNKPTFFRAKYFPSESTGVVFEEKVIKEGFVHSTNNVSRDTSLTLARKDEIALAFKEAELEYGEDSYQVRIIVDGMAAKINEESSIGGDFFLYSLRENSPEFTKEVIYQLSAPTSELVSLRRVTMEANGTLT